MTKKSEHGPSMLSIDEASSVYTREIAGNIINTCASLLQEPLPHSVLEKIADIDSSCCHLIRNRLLLSKLLQLHFANGKTKYCCFADVYTNCCETVNAICANEKIPFGYSGFINPHKVNATSEECALLILLPIAVVLEKSDTDFIRLLVASKKNAITMEFSFSCDFPDIASLASECEIEGKNNGIFFDLPLLACVLYNTTEKLGAKLEASDKKVVITIPAAGSEMTINSPSEPYIDNRFSLPYIILSKIIKREI